MVFTYQIGDIQNTSEKFWQQMGSSKVFAFHGQMGTGKTTFIHALCGVKGVKDVVGSPTFSIINEYAYTDNGVVKKIYHIDLYRLKDEEEAIRAGVEDCLYSNDICLVEWPEKAPGIFPADTVHIYMQPVDTQTRRVEIGDK